MMTAQIRQVVAQHGRLSVDVETLSDEADLYGAGLTSHATVDLMLALEDEFDVEFPERLLRLGTFESIDALRGAIEELVDAHATTS
jgi:acyl carrier protein